MDMSSTFSNYSYPLLGEISKEISEQNKEAEGGSSVDKRTVFTSYQLQALEETFIRQTFLSREERIELGIELNLTERQIMIWFQNRRGRFKKRGITDKAFVKKQKNLGLLESFRSAALNLPIQQHVDQGVKKSNGLDKGIYKSNGLNNGVYKSNQLDHQVHKFNGLENGVYKSNGLDNKVYIFNGLDHTVPKSNGLNHQLTNHTNGTNYNVSYNGLTCEREQQNFAMGPPTSQTIQWNDYDLFQQRSSMSYGCCLASGCCDGSYSFQDSNYFSQTTPTWLLSHLQTPSLPRISNHTNGFNQEKLTSPQGTTSFTNSSRPAINQRQSVNNIYFNDNVNEKSTRPTTTSGVSNSTTGLNHFSIDQNDLYRSAETFNSDYGNNQHLIGRF